MMLLVPTVAALLAAGGDDLLIWQYPMVMAHDAATGYLKADINNDVYKWTITQNGSFDKMLDCGARSLDLRPTINDKGDLIMHHGPVDVNTPLVGALSDIVQWLANNPTEIVVVVIADCTGPNCEEEVSRCLSGMQIKSLRGDFGCGYISTMTVAQAKQEFKLPRGGSLLTIFDCSASNYDPSISCYPDTASNADVLSCYGNFSESAFNAMWGYMNRTSERFQKRNSLSQIQCLWQEGTNTVVLGDAYGSSLIKDETRSQLNLKALEKLRAGWWEDINLFEINNVCDQGNAIAAELLKRANAK